MNVPEDTSATKDDPIASPWDNACKTNPKVVAKPFPEVEIVDPSPVEVRIAGGCRLQVRADRPTSLSSASASKSKIETLGENEREVGV